MDYEGIEINVGDVVKVDEGTDYLIVRTLRRDGMSEGGVEEFSFDGITAVNLNQNVIVYGDFKFDEIDKLMHLLREDLDDEDDIKWCGYKIKKWNGEEMEGNWFK